MGKIIELNKADFESVISGGTVLVDFFATWCNPCKMFGKILEQAEKECAENVIIAKVDIDKDPELAIRFGVNTVPHVVVFKDGNVTFERPGVLTKPEVLELLK
jgi:thioredoxin 1